MSEKEKNPNQARGKETAPGQNKVFVNPVTGEQRTGTMGQFNKENWADEGFEPQDTDDTTPVAEEPPA